MSNDRTYPSWRNSVAPMSKPLGVALLVILLLAAVVGGLTPDIASAEPLGHNLRTSGAESSQASSATPVTARRVLVVAAPRLTWGVLKDHDAPNMSRFLERASVAAMSPRTVGPTTIAADAYLSLGAGNRVSGGSSSDGVVAEIGEQTLAGDPVALYRRSTGIEPTSPILALGLPGIERVNDSLLYGASPGAMVDALEAADKRVAAVGNADLRFGIPDGRQFALAAMDSTGQIAAGRVGPELLVADDAAPFGIRLDTEVYLRAVETAWSDSDVVIAELSDLERAEAARNVSIGTQAERLQAQSLVRSDELFGELLKSVDLSQDLVILAGTTPPSSGNELMVFGMDGIGTAPDRAWAISGSTRREGYVALTDIASTVLSSLGVEVPNSANDTRIRSIGDPAPLTERLDSMISWSHRAVIRDEVFGLMSVIFIVILLAALVSTILCLSRLPRIAGVSRWLSLWVLAILSSVYLVALVPAAYASGVSLVFWILALAAALATAASFGATVARSLPPILLVALLWAVLAIDIVTGAELQMNTMFGYSAIVAGRFAGMGNQAFSMFMISVLLLSAAWVTYRERAGSNSLDAVEDKPDSGVVSWSTLSAVIALSIVSIVIDGAPSLGSDVGGVLAFGPAAAIAVLMYRKIRVSLRLLVVIGLSSVGVLALFAGLDYTRPSSEQTHLGRFVKKLLDGDAGVIFQRKLQANINLLGAIWTWIIPIALAYLTYLMWRPNHTLTQLLTTFPAARVFGVSGLTLGVLAMGVNDSGVSMPAMMLAIALATISYLAINLDLGGIDQSTEDDGIDDGDAMPTDTAKAALQ